MVNEGRHPKNSIAQALAAVDRPGLIVHEVHRSHRWGALMCQVCGNDFAIPSTPRDPDNTAKDIRRFERKHRHHEESQ